ncbi:MAG: hypothetical protein ABN478_15080, partial [Mixta sp.]
SIIASTRDNKLRRNSLLVWLDLLRFREIPSATLTRAIGSPSRFYSRRIETPDKADTVNALNCYCIRRQNLVIRPAPEIGFFCF